VPQGETEWEFGRDLKKVAEEENVRFRRKAHAPQKTHFSVASGEGNRRGEKRTNNAKIKKRLKNSAEEGANKRVSTVVR